MLAEIIQLFWNVSLILSTTYYSQNYASIIDTCLQIFCSIQSAENVSDQHINKYLLLAIEQTNRISLASLTIYNVMHVINHAVGGVVFKRHQDQTITKCLYNLFL